MCGRTVAPVCAVLASLSLALPGNANAQTDRRPMCHRTGTGFYEFTSVGAVASRAHKGHGDAAVGQPVPGFPPGFVFDSNCRPVASCPLSGDWVGQFFQPDNSPIPYAIALSSVNTAAAVGEVFASVNYPAFAACSGHWIVENVKDNSFWVSETLGGTCYSGTVYRVVIDAPACAVDGVGIWNPLIRSLDAIIPYWTFTLSKP
jgi:hypothetical protein